MHYLCVVYQDDRKIAALPDPELDERGFDLAAR